MVEVFLEKITNIAMGTEIDNLVEFNDLAESIADLTSGGRAAYRLASEPIGRLRRRARPWLLCRTRKPDREPLASATAPPSSQTSM